MLITTTNELPGYAIEEVFGEVFGLTVRSRNIGSQFGASLKSILGGELKGMTTALVDSRNQVIQGRGGGAGAKGGKGGHARQRGRRDGLRHERDGPELDGDLRVRDGCACEEGRLTMGFLRRKKEP